MVASVKDGSLEQRLHVAVAQGLPPNFGRFLRFLAHREGELLELQVLGDRPQFAHSFSFPTNVELLLRAERFSDVSGIYVVANVVNDAVASRKPVGQWHYAARGAGTTDRDIVARRLLLIDVDAVRPSGTSATDEEVALTVPIAEAIYERVAAALSSDRSIGYCHSGNGRQINLALDHIAESAALAERIRRILRCLSLQFSTDLVKVDVSVCDPKRLVPAFGTMKRKGVAGRADRPHRRTALICAEDVVRLKFDDLVHLDEKLAPSGLVVSAPSQSTTRTAPSPQVADAKPQDSVFRRVNDVPIIDVAEWLQIMEGSGVRCPGCGNTDGVALVGNGLKCHHRTCAERGVKGRPGFRTVIDLVMEAHGIGMMQAVERIAQRFSVELPRKCDAAELKRLWQSSAKPEAEESSCGFETFACTDSGNAERLVHRHGRDIRYCGPWGKYLVWDGRRWALDDQNRVLELTKDVARNILPELLEAGVDEKDALKFALDSESATRRTAMVKLAACFPSVTVHHSQLDAKPLLLTCRNGTLDLTTGRLGAHARDHLIMKMASCDFDASAQCPQWRQFLRRIMNGNDELIEFLQRAVGYTLTGDVSEQVLFFLHGVGANGKSTLLRVLSDMLGEYAVQAAPDLLVTKKQDAHPTEVAALFGARLAVCQEIEAQRSFAEVRVKQLTGNDLMIGRRMRENFWEFVPTHKLFIAANHKPRVDASDYAMWRRIRLIPFSVTVPPQERDPRLLDKLKSELPGILGWAVEGCLAWQREGLKPPPSVVEATEEYREEEDVFADFLRERCVTGTYERVRSGDLYDAYVRWCEATSIRPKSQRAVAELLKRKEFEKSRSSGGTRIWLGLRLKTPDELRAGAEAEDDDEREERLAIQQTDTH